MRKWLCATAAGLLLAGCATSRSSIENKEALLANAGFLVLPGDTSGYAAALRQIPPHTFIHNTAGGLTTYYYLDPTACGCLYYGNEQSWAAYQREVADVLHMQAEQLLERADTPFSGQGG